MSSEMAVDIGVVKDVAYYENLLKAGMTDSDWVIFVCEKDHDRVIHYHGDVVVADMSSDNGVTEPMRDLLMRKLPTFYIVKSYKHIADSVRKSDLSSCLGDSCHTDEPTDEIIVRTVAKVASLLPYRLKLTEVRMAPGAELGFASERMPFADFLYALVHELTDVALADDRMFFCLNGIPHAVKVGKLVVITPDGNNMITFQSVDDLSGLTKHVYDVVIKAGVKMSDYMTAKHPICVEIPVQTRFVIGMDREGNFTAVPVRTSRYPVI